MSRSGDLFRAVAVASVVAVVLVLLPVTALANGRFFDDDGNVHEGYIEAIAEAGITKGCAGSMYCPADPVTRGQMAAFLVRALDLTDPGEGDLFTDDDDSIFEGDIDRLATAGITKGCNPPENNRFCPEEAVTRGQMAAFLVRAFGLADPGEGDLFTDDDNSIFEDQIDRLATAGITKGCNPPENDRFCPNDVVRRDEMASFLGRALGLEPIEPPPAQNLEITDAQFDAPGDDRTNLNGEWVEITNVGDQNQVMGAWTLHDEGRSHTYSFPPGPPSGEWFLAPGASVRVHTGDGGEDIDTLYWRLDGPVWNNDGDTAYLRDGDGNIVDTYSGP